MVPFGVKSVEACSTDAFRPRGGEESESADVARGRSSTLIGPSFSEILGMQITRVLLVESSKAFE